MIREYKEEDREFIIDLFVSELNGNYISHGEIQMGLSRDGISLEPDYLEKWIKYLDRQIVDTNVFISVYQEENKVLGFIISGIESDFDDNYGIIYDVVISKGTRGGGVGRKLLDYACKQLEEHNIFNFFLESGATNHGAHKFFEKIGFSCISNTFWLNTKNKKTDS